jgi:hypothetical protein
MIVMVNAARTWTWSAAGGWSQASSVHAPILDGTAMVYDSGHNNALLFGSVTIPLHGPIELRSVTWTWNGSDSSLLQPPQSPPARWLESIFFDEYAGHVVLFGGCTDLACRQKLDDMWQWDGETWMELHPTTMPTGRSGAVMAYLPQTSQVIMFGGFDPAGFRGETWIWNGTDWNQRMPGTSPDLQAMLPLARDPKIDGAPLFGAAPGNSSATDSWLWDGTTWRHPAQTTHPDLVTIDLVFDDALGVDLLVGTSGDVWSSGGL